MALCDDAIVSSVMYRNLTQSMDIARSPRKVWYIRTYTYHLMHTIIHIPSLYSNIHTYIQRYIHTYVLIFVWHRIALYGTVWQPYSPTIIVMYRLYGMTLPLYTMCRNLDTKHGHRTHIPSFWWHLSSVYYHVMLDTYRQVSCNHACYVHI